MDVLKIAYHPSIKMQAVRCTLTDMWALWSLLLLQFGQNATLLAKNILKSMNEREHVIKNPILYAALFFDPRYESLLKSGEQQIAMCELLNLHNRLNKESEIDEVWEIDELELMLMAAEINNIDVEEEANIDITRTIHQELEVFKKLKRVDKETTILLFWKG